MASTASKLARLTVDGKEYNVFQAGFESVKPVDSWNRVTAFATKADAKFVIEGKDDTTALFEKFSNSRKRFDAKLTLFNTHDEGKLVETEYKECSITYFSTNYNAANEFPYTVTIVLSPKTTKQGSGELTFDQNS
ncbi:type VI secretion system tube protein TssD [Chitinophagaceae bacterium 26-R-25]|nr:type VI secretion system tube protein TssD [Chitinophagaceae bacterium 26-R-25]